MSGFFEKTLRERTSKKGRASPLPKRICNSRKKCKFPKSGHVGTVYDWVGSLSLTPEYFTLSIFDSMDLNPASPIETVD